MGTFITGKLYWFLKNQSIVRILIFLVCEWTVDAIAIRIRHNCCLTRMMTEFNCFLFYGMHPPVLSLMTTLFFLRITLHLFYSLFCEFVNLIWCLFCQGGVQNLQATQAVAAFSQKIQVKLFSMSMLCRHTKI